ncbi:hypothetical protein Efla_006986 [Eimeria flavescens]
MLKEAGRRRTETPRKPHRRRSRRRDAGRPCRLCKRAGPALAKRFFSEEADESRALKPPPETAAQRLPRRRPAIVAAPLLGLILISVLTVASLALKCAARLRAGQWLHSAGAAGAGPSLQSRRLAEGGAHVLATCSPGAGNEGPDSEVEQQKELLSLSEEEKAGLTGEEIRAIQSAQRKIVALSKDYMKKRRQAQRFAEAIATSESLLRAQLDDLPPGLLEQTTISLTERQIADQKAQLRVFEEQALASNGALAATGYTPVQDAPAILDQALRLVTPERPTISSAAAQALAAARFVLQGPEAIQIPKLNDQEAKAVQQLSEALVKELQTLQEGVSNTERNLSRPSDFWYKKNEANKKCNEARRYSSALKLLKLNSMADQLCESVESLERALQTAATELKAATANWQESTQRLRGRLEAATADISIQNLVPGIRQRLEEHVHARLKQALAERPQSQQDIKKLLAIYLECKQQVDEARDLVAQAGHIPITKVLQMSLEPVQKALASLKLVLKEHWMNQVTTASELVVDARRGCREAFRVAKATRESASSAAPGARARLAQQEMKSSSKLEPEQNNLLFFVKHIQAVCAKAASTVSVVAPNIKYCEGLTEALEALGTTVGSAEEDAEEAMKWLASVWEKDLSAALDSREDAAERLQQARGDGHQGKVAEAVLNHNASNNLLDLALTTAVRGMGQLQDLECPRDLTKGLRAAIKRGNSVVPAVVGTGPLELDTSGRGKPQQPGRRVGRWGRMWASKSMGSLHKVRTDEEPLRQSSPFRAVSSGSSQSLKRGSSALPTLTEAWSATLLAGLDSESAGDVQGARRARSAGRLASLQLGYEEDDDEDLVPTSSMSSLALTDKSKATRGSLPSSSKRHLVARSVSLSADDYPEKKKHPGGRRVFKTLSSASRAASLPTVTSSISAPPHEPQSPFPTDEAASPVATGKKSKTTRWKSLRTLAFLRRSPKSRSSSPEKEEKEEKKHGKKKHGKKR